MYEIQNEITTSMKFGGKVLAKDALATLLVVQYGLKLSNLAYRPLQIPCLIFILAVFLFWMLPSRGNKAKRNYHRLYYILSKNRATYYSMETYSYDSNTKLDESYETDEELGLYGETPEQ